MANTTLKVRNRIATKTTTEWETENPILLKGEMGYDSTSKRYKIGDGVNTWKNLEYTTINGKSKLTLFKSSTKTNQYDGTADLTIVPSDVVGAMENGNTDITDNTEFITSNTNGFNYSGSVNVPYRRKATYIWNWIKSKLSANAITTPGIIIPNGTASQVLLANGTTNTLKTINNQSLLGSGNIDITQSLTNEINTLKTELQNAKAEIAYLKSVAPVVTAENGFYVVDGNGNIGFKVDENGATDSATTSIDTTNVD